MFVQSSIIKLLVSIDPLINSLIAKYKFLIFVPECTCSTSHSTDVKLLVWQNNLSYHVVT